MARPLRIQYENAVYHVTCRGNAQQDIFADDHDRARFISLLQRSSEIYQVSVAAFVLMRNHFHLLVRTPGANLQEFMRHFNISYTSAFNRRHKRAGHLYQGRYKSFLVDADSYLLEVSRYIHLNPVRVMPEASPEERKRYIREYRWSSYPDYIGGKDRYPFLAAGDVLDVFHPDRRRAQRSYRSFVEKALTSSLPNPLEQGRGHGIVGEKGFLEKVMSSLVPAQGDHRRVVPQARRLTGQTQPGRIILVVSSFYGMTGEEVLNKKNRGESRHVLIELLYRYGGMNGREIGRMIGIDYSTVSVARKRLSEKMEHDTKVKQRFRELEDRLHIQE